MKKALCWHGCDLFHHFSFNERLDAVRSSDAADARIQQPPHVHEHQTMKGDLRVFLRLLHTQTRKNTHCDHTIYARLTEREKCNTESSHQLGISCFLPHYLQRPQSAVEDLLTQPEMRVISEVEARFTYI